MGAALQIATLRYYGDFASSRFTAQVLATRGERLAFERVRLEFEGGDVGPSQSDTLLVTEMDEHGDIVDPVRFEADELDAAYAELDARYDAGEAAH